MPQESRRHTPQEKSAVGFVLYVFVSLAAGFVTFFRQFEGVTCSATGTCDGVVMYYAVQPFLWINGVLLVLVVSASIVLWVRRTSNVWLPVSALIFISVYAVIANIVFTVAKTTGNG
ncbi:hypothetical protein LTA6_001467 [Microbacterium sp. LTA6]|uniref:hypothetical protein n=1 Tax=unclassified Microbacterium TaxID=2609290 RepID=UPI003139C975